VLPAGEIDYRVMPGRSSNPARLRLRIYVFVDGAEEARLNTSARVDMTARVAVASRLLDAGGAIGPQDVRMAEVSVTRLPKDVLTAPDQAVGMVPRRRIAAGKPLEASDLEQEMLVEKGDMVTLVAESGTLRVTSPGQARRDGVEGEEVPVLNLSSKKTVVGRVVDSRTIAVNF
jgi:flagella basal body P-ring formation protein FlgA